MFCNSKTISWYYIVGNLTWNSQPLRKKKNRETHAKEKKKTITRTRHCLHGSASCQRLRSCKDFTNIREKYKVWLQFFTLLRTTTIDPNHQNNLFYILHTGFTTGYKTGQKIDCNWASMRVWCHLHFVLNSISPYLK